MVHTWLLRRGLRRLLTGLILFLVGFIVFTYLMGQPVETTSLFHSIKRPNPESALKHIISTLTRAKMGVAIGAIGIISAIFGVGYLLVTVVLEHIKKRRYAQRSKT